MFERLVTAALICLFAGTLATATPLQTGSWTQVARMADGDPGMFDGNCDLGPACSFGTFTSSLQATDFEVSFNVVPGMSILFITGDESIWAATSYAGLRNLIDARGGSFAPNITFEASVAGVSQTLIGNVLSRSGPAEDPWISLQGDHFSAVAGGLILWGEANFAGPHALLKNSHLGVNVFVGNDIVTAVPGPIAGAGLPGLILAGGGLLGWLRRRKGAQAVVA